MADPRRPIVASRAVTDELAVICDDGAVFQYVGRRWKEVAPAPGIAPRRRSGVEARPEAAASETLSRLPSDE